MGHLSANTTYAFNKFDMLIVQIIIKYIYNLHAFLVNQPITKYSPTLVSFLEIPSSLTSLITFPLIVSHAKQNF